MSPYLWPGATCFWSCWLCVGLAYASSYAHTQVKISQLWSALAYPFALRPRFHERFKHFCKEKIDGDTVVTERFCSRT